MSTRSLAHTKQERAVYSPESALAALRGILAEKTTHYGVFTRPTRLIGYYGQAVAYNTTFEKIYLLNALEPELEAFEIFPMRAVQLIAVGSAPPTRVRALVEASASELQ